MEIKRLHINQVLTGIMLWVFSIAITPWAAFHHHKEIDEGPVEINCTHKFHIKAQQENCLICKVHFEKNYTVSKLVSITYLESILVKRIVLTPSSAYTASISTLLRGPPVIS